MGNLCSSGADAPADGKASAHQQQYAPGTPSNKPPASQAGPSKGQLVDPIDAAIAEAKRELEKNKGQDFHNKYKVSKLVGHGAFAKVMICSHVDTHEKYAVKTVQKNLEEPQKQREGGRLNGSGSGSTHDCHGGGVLLPSVDTGAHAYRPRPPAHPSVCVVGRGRACGLHSQPVHAGAMTESRWRWHHEGLNACFGVYYRCDQGDCNHAHAPRPPKHHQALRGV